MKRIRLFAILVTAITALSLLAVSLPAFGQKAESWQIVVSKSLMEDEAIRVALEDLKKAGKELGLIFKVASDTTESLKNAIIVGDAGRNKVTAALIKQGKIRLEGVSDEQGYEIRTITTDGGRTIIVAGGSVIGDVYGLYWIWDRMRVFKEVPEINVKKVPALKIRFVEGGGSEEGMKNALKYGVNWVCGENPLNLVPWETEPERTGNEKNREKTKKLIKYAHSLHMKYLTYCDEFTYHPSLLKEFGATLSPSDPAFWDALQAKYRRLLQAMPELDGVRIRTGELTSIWGNYKAFDIMHDGQGCDWSIEKRYRTFVKKIYDVVVGQFDKIYHHRTWVTNVHEQHSQPDVFRKTFTEDVPTKNLYLVPKITTADQWFHMPYNPTFNVTAHNTIVQFEQHIAHDPYGFPCFPGEYFQAGLQTITAPKANNIKGIDFVGIPQAGWDKGNVTVYTLSRLAWNPQENMRKIAEDFASIHFGRAAAKQMAEIYLLSPVAFKYGIYMEPVADVLWNPVPHFWSSVFPSQGYSSIDKGKEHIHWLYSMYLRCKPWMPETLDYLDHGLQTSNKMSQIFQQVKPLIRDKKLARDVENLLELTRLLIQTNNFYVKTFFAYFEYRDDPTVENRDRLSKLSSGLKDTVKRFIKTPGYGYQLFGVEQLLINIEQVLQDLTKAEQILAKAPEPVEIKRTIADQQEKYAKVLEEHSKNAVKFLHWEGRVDGRDILKIKGNNLEVEHLRWNEIAGMAHSFLRSLPNKPVTVIPRAIESRPIHPFILQQPTKENNYTVKVYLYDSPGGLGWWKFDLYYIPKLPEEVGLEIPWEK